jgi:D-alanyl-D-alanine carboxypeptidase
LSKSNNSQRAADHFDKYFQKIQSKHKNKPIQIKVYSQNLDLDYSYPPDSSNQPYHVASIGKLFTATLVQILAEQGSLGVKNLIIDYLPAAVLEKLFEYQGHDYAGQVTIEQLLGHTSGIADYFEGDTTEGKTFFTEILTNPSFHWTPEKLLAYSRNHQRAVGIPGKVFNYSDTGYILLGLIIEKVTGKTFAQNLVDEFFLPLEMGSSYLMFHSEPVNTPKKEINKIWFNNIEVSGFESLSCDWAGGGIVSTTADLIKFNLALREGRLIQSNSLASMDICNHKFQQGIYYGLGMMEIRFKDFFFLLAKLPKIKGHIGILSTHLFFDPSTQAHIAMNFGSNTFMEGSFRVLIEIENTLQRMR